MRLLYFINNIINSGGIERIIIDKVNYLSHIKGYDIAIAYYGNPNDIPFFDISYKVKLYAIPLDMNTFSFRKKIRYSFSVKKSVIQIIQEFYPDIIINANTKLVSWILPFIARRIPKIIELHFSYDGLMIMNQNLYNNNFLKASFNNLLRRLIYPLYNKCVVLSQDDLSKWNFKNICIIPNFTNLTNYTYSNLSVKTALCVGRLEFQKNIDLLIDAWKIVAESFPDWKLNIWGDGSLRSQIQEQIKKSNLENKINLCGVSKNILNEYLNASIFILPSRYEGLPLVLIEAMQSGLPAIGFNISGVNDVIIHNKNGILVQEREPESLAKNIIQLLSNNEMLHKMSQNAITTMSKFKKEHVMNQWITLFNELAKNK